MTTAVVLIIWLFPATIVAVCLVAQEHEGFKAHPELGPMNWEAVIPLAVILGLLWPLASLLTLISRIRGRGNA